MNVPRMVGLVALVGAVSVGVLTRPTPVAARPALATMPVSEVRVGMRGYAETVFKGTSTDRFEIEVVDVIHNYLPKQDAVLFRSTDPRMAHSGIVGGMSGSPIYIDGKLVGALSYGWRFNKDALGALTPIDNMKEVGALPYRPEVLPHPKVRGTRAGTKAWADVMLGLDTSPLPARRPARALDPLEALMPLATPMSLAGLGNGAADLLAESFGLVPVRGGSSGQSSETAPPPPRTWKGGDSVSVVMIEGDSSVAGNGTVTWVSPNGDRLLAFGHSMFDDGPTNVPMADARVHTIINSLERSVKVSSPLTIRGLMYQDRQAAIALRTDAVAPMIPVSTVIQGPDPDLKPRRYENRVAVGVDLTPNLIAAVLAEAVDEGGGDATAVVLHVQHAIDVETTQGLRTLHMEEEVFFPRGLVGRVMQRSRGVMTVAALFDNDFEVARIHGIRQELRMEYGTPIERIEAVRVVDDEVRAGELVRFQLTMRDYQGTPRVEILPLRIPDDAAGEEVQVEIAGGDYVRPYRPIPASLDDLLGTLEASYPSRALVATVYRQAEGLATRGGLMTQLPDSVLETLAESGSTRDAVRLKQMARRVIPTEKLVEGAHSIRVPVLSPKTL